jgi:hydroxymethylpyrimidine pyrophosphatase-like HAD family hydrolase
LPTPIRMIAVDMDGTLLGEDGQVSPRNLAALLAAEAAGVTVVVATGRRHCYAMHILRPLGLDAASILISSNGSVTRTLGSFGADPVPSQLIARNHLTRATALWLCGILAEFRNALVLTFDRVGPDGEDSRGALVVEHMDELTASIGRWIIVNEPYIAHVNPIEQALTASPNGDVNHNSPIQAMLCGTVERMARAQARLLEHPGVVASDDLPSHSVVATKSPGAPSIALSSRSVESQNSTEPILNLHRTVYAAGDLSILDILPPGCSKGAAILSLAASQAIDPSEILAIGDNWNDVSMLEIAGSAVLMENAPEDLKVLAHSRGWRIGLANTDHGVAEAIESALSVTC